MASITREYTVDTESGKQVTVEAEVTGTFDSNYGADADGNRGVARWESDHTFNVPPVDDDGATLTEAEKLEVSTLVNKAIDEDDFDFDEANEPEYDNERDL